MPRDGWIERQAAKVKAQEPQMPKWLVSKVKRARMSHLDRIRVLEGEIRESWHQVDSEGLREWCAFCAGDFWEGGKGEHEPYCIVLTLPQPVEVRDASPA